MDATHTFDEQLAGSLLAGADDDIARGLALIDRHLRLRLCGWLRRRFPALTPDDLANAWAETLLGALLAARKGRFDPDRPLLPWLCRIANARATDLTRRAVAFREAVRAAAAALRSARAGRGWLALGEGERSEVLALIHEAIALLPQQQRAVLQVFVAHYPETQSMRALQAEVSRATGRPETLASVKRALQEGRLKVRAFLRRKGYAEAERGDP